MIGNTFQQLFLIGANELATAPIEYGEIQAAAGWTQDDWELLTTKNCWNKTEQQKLPSLLSNTVSITLKTAGLPAISLPGCYIAAVICKLVSPCNRLLAALSAPESFDSMSASGIVDSSEIIVTTKQQMMALVVYFSSADFAALSSWRMNEDIAQAVLANQLEA